jgi:hypothetical protein
MGEWRYSSTILDLCTRWRWVVSFTPWLFYPRGKNPRYPLDRILCGPQNRSGGCAEEKNLAPAGNSEFKTIWKEEVAAYCKVLSWHSSGGTEKDRKNVRIVLPQPEFEPGSVLIYIRNFTACARFPGGSVDYLAHFISETYVKVCRTLSMQRDGRNVLHVSTRSLI